ncbi:MAG: hypothetical protein FH749_04500 [Firmicutes bacterium]|nr:hypothetical protein [Bacillota bacterium]
MGLQTIARGKINILHILMVVILVFTGYFLYTSRTEIRERYLNRGLITEVKKEHGDYLKLDYIRMDDEQKLCSFTYVRRKVHPDEPELYNRVRETVNSYLKSNPDFFLNEGFKIEFIIRYTGNSPHIVSFVNHNYSEDALLYDGLHGVTTEGEEPFYYLTDLAPFSKVKTLRIYRVSIDDLSILSNFDDLERLILYDGFSEKDILEIRQILPDSIIEVK